MKNNKSKKEPDTLINKEEALEIKMRILANHILDRVIEDYNNGLLTNTSKSTTIKKDTI